MLNKFLNFIKYNNATLLIVAVIFIIGATAFAAGNPETLGTKQAKIEGVDNTLLLSADLDNMDMDYKVERIEEDADYYYVTYTYLDLGLNQADNAWQYQLTERVRKISKKDKDDLGLYLAEEFKELYLARIKELKKEQVSAQEAGEQKRVEVTSYNGLIGKALDITGGIFTGYEPVKKVDLPSPDLAAYTNLRNSADSSATAHDNLTEIYNNYVNENDPDHDNFFNSTDNCPDIANPGQLDADNDGIGDACDDTNTPGQTVNSPAAAESSQETQAPSGQAPDNGSAIEDSTTDVEVIDFSQPATDSVPPVETAPENNPTPQADTGSSVVSP